MLPWRRSVTHLSSAKASATDRFFLRVCLNRAGNESQRGAEPNHEDVQNLAVLPSPMVTVVAEANNLLSASSHGTGKSCHGRCGCCHCSHSHLSRRARLNLCMSCSPSPSLSVGEQTLLQPTLHLAPVRSIAKNSWGQAWGQKGFFFMRRGADGPRGLCGMAMYGAYPVM